MVLSKHLYNYYKLLILKEIKRGGLPLWKRKVSQKTMLAPRTPLALAVGVVRPSDSIAHIVSQLKGYTSFKLREEFPLLKSKLPSMWTRSYYVETIGHISEQTISKYIEEQKMK